IRLSTGRSTSTLSWWLIQPSASAGTSLRRLWSLRRSRSRRRKVLKRCLIDRVIPDIRVNTPPVCRQHTLYIQQDDAGPHRVKVDQELPVALSGGVWDMQLINQPASSPDKNVMDLRFFYSTRFLQDWTTPLTIDHLIDAMKDAFKRGRASTLESVWRTLQAVLQEIMLCKGNNSFNVPHVWKATMGMRDMPLPRQLEYSP
ncbi:unnamed protein product, partial [Discosporangium mesarthrocarpum]